MLTMKQIVEELFNNPESTESNLYLHGIHSDSGTFADFASKCPMTFQEIQERLGTKTVLDTYNRIRDLKPEIISVFTSKFRLCKG